MKNPPLEPIDCPLTPGVRAMLTKPTISHDTRNSRISAKGEASALGKVEVWKPKTQKSATNLGISWDILGLWEGKHEGNE